MLFLKLYFLNFSAINGSSATSKNENNNVKPINILGLEIIEFAKLLFSPNVQISGIEIKNKVLAGVGSPIKVSDCRVSILNLANRIPEKTETKKPKKGVYCWFLIISSKEET